MNELQLAIYNHAQNLIVEIVELKGSTLAYTTPETFVDQIIADIQKEVGEVEFKAFVVNHPSAWCDAHQFIKNTIINWKRFHDNKFQLLCAPLSRYDSELHDSLFPLALTGEYVISGNYLEHKGTRLLLEILAKPKNVPFFTAIQGDKIDKASINYLTHCCQSYGEILACEYAYYPKALNLYVQLLDDGDLALKSVNNSAWQAVNKFTPIVVDDLDYFNEDNSLVVGACFDNADYWSLPRDLSCSTSDCRVTVEDGEFRLYCTKEFLKAAGHKEKVVD